MLHSPKYYLDCVERGIHLYWRALGKMRGMLTHSGDIEYVLSQTRSGPERVYRVRLSADGIERRVEEIAAGIRAGEIPNGLLLGPGTTPANLPEFLARHGFHVDASDPCMALDLADFHHGVGLPDGAQMGLVSDERQVSEWAQVVNLGLFGCELISAEQFTDVFHLEHARLFLAYHNGLPACAAMTLRDGDLATLEFVATLAEQRRKGLGTAVTCAALRDLRDLGARTVTLRAEPDGVNIYQKVGFQVVCQRVVASLPE
ncbi:MAG TPA: GNAT family N-acetyltransferase [Anaerolineaceae bacterium]|nr:GNAT family N-acetyltransferase [Anaerolineaceae bacterium]